jgi:hypothetical protein
VYCLIISSSEGLCFISFPDYTSYLPELPETILVHPKFGETLQLFVDGSIPGKMSRDVLPTFTITDHDNMAVLKIWFDPQDTNMLVRLESDLDGVSIFSC